MVQKQPGELFDLAVLLDGDSRENLCDLAERAKPNLGHSLREQLAEFDRFQGLFNQKDAVSNLLIQLKTAHAPAEDGEKTFQTKLQAPDVAGVPAKIGHYRIEREIKRGGQGTVYLAYQETTDRPVALKLIHMGLASLPEHGTRLNREMKVLAMMDHDHIAAIYEADTTAEGFPFFSMEYVDGTDILNYCRNHRLGLHQRLELFLQVCEGVSHAHQRLILHRDLKPSNILVTEKTGKARVKIVDFGIARGLDSGREMGKPLTATGVVGTPGYLAPEMFHKAEPDTRHDIYALGVVLYQLVTDREPLTPPPHLSWDEKWRYYRQREPRPPSNLLPKKTRGASDLDAITAKAMAKEPDRRYASVIELHQDCRNFLEGLPVSARSPSRLYLLRGLVARNKMLVTTTTLILMTLVLGLVGTSLAQRETQKERARFEKSFATLERVLAAPDPYQMGAQARMVDVLRTGEANFEDDFGQDRELESMIRAVWGSTYYGLGFYEDARAHLQKTAAILTQNHGPADIRTLKARHQLVRVAIGEGRYDAAEKELRNIYALYPAKGFENEKLFLLAGLVDVFQAQGRPERAQPLLPEMEKHISPAASIEDRSRWCFTIANIHHGLGNAEQAESYYRQAMNLLTSADNPNPQTLAVMSGLANHLRRRDRSREAEALYRRVIALRGRRLGEHHPLTQRGRAGLALCLMDQQRQEEAEPLISAVAMALSRRNASHPETLAMIRRSAVVLRHGGKHEKALQLLRELVAHYRDNGLGASLDALKASSNLADLHILMGDHEAAVEILTPTIQGFTNHLGPHHLATTTAIMTLGQAHQEGGDRLRADEVYKRAIEGLTLSRPHTRELPYYRAIRAHNLSGMRRFEEAEKILLKSLAATPTSSAYHAEIQRYLAAHYRARGDQATARQYDKP